VSPKKESFSGALLELKGEIMAREEIKTRFQGDNTGLMYQI
jgi:hypothetical protein